MLLYLKQKEDMAIDERIKMYDVKHQENPSVYPLLPLSNAIKNQFFQGIIEGGKKRHSKSRKRLH